MVMVLGIISMIHGIHGIGTMDGATVGLGDLGIAGMAASGVGAILTVGHTGVGDQVGAVLFIILLTIVIVCLVISTQLVDTWLQATVSARMLWVVAI
jgi:hypothetical protein